jgi:hypothetical protein
LTAVSTRSKTNAESSSRGRWLATRHAKLRWSSLAQCAGKTYTASESGQSIANRRSPELEKVLELSKSISTRTQISSPLASHLLTRILRTASSLCTTMITRGQRREGQDAGQPAVNVSSRPYREMRRTEYPSGDRFGRARSDSFHIRLNHRAMAPQTTISDQASPAILAATRKSYPLHPCAELGSCASWIPATSFCRFQKSPSHRVQ